MAKAPSALNRGGEIKRLETQARSLEKLIADLRKALESTPVAKQAPFEPLRGKLPWPVQQGKVLARFGQPRAGFRSRERDDRLGAEKFRACEQRGFDLRDALFSRR